MAYRRSPKDVRKMAEILDYSVRQLGWYDTTRYAMSFDAGSPINGQPYRMTLAEIHSGGWATGGYPGLPSRLGDTAKEAMNTLETFHETVSFVWRFYG